MEEGRFSANTVTMRLEYAIVQFGADVMTVPAASLTVHSGATQAPINVLPTKADHIVTPNIEHEE